MFLYNRPELFIVHVLKIRQEFEDQQSIRMYYLTRWRTSMCVAGMVPLIITLQGSPSKNLSRCCLELFPLYLYIVCVYKMSNMFSTTCVNGVVFNISLFYPGLMHFHFTPYIAIILKLNHVQMLIKTILKTQITFVRFSFQKLTLG